VGVGDGEGFGLGDDAGFDGRHKKMIRDATATTKTTATIIAHSRDDKPQHLVDNFEDVFLSGGIRKG